MLLQPVWKAHDLKQPGMRLVTAKVTLSPKECKTFSTVSQARVDDWLFGRIVAKDAIRKVWAEHTGEKLFLADIEIEPDQWGRPIATFRDQKRTEVLPTVSIAHTAGLAVGIAALTPYVGIDVERIEPRDKGFIDIAFDANEQKLLQLYEQNEAVARFWCAKEAVSKALGRGLIAGPHSLFVRAVDLETNELHIELGKELAEQFPEFKEVLLLAHTVKEQDSIIATSFCKRCSYVHNN